MLLSIKIERKVKGKIVVKLESAYLLWYMLAVGRMTFRCLYRAVYRHYYSYFYHFLLQFPFLRVCFLFMVESFVVVFFFLPYIFVLCSFHFFFSLWCMCVCAFAMLISLGFCFQSLHFSNAFRKLPYLRLCVAHWIFICWKEMVQHNFLSIFKLCASFLLAVELNCVWTKS